MEQSRVRVTLAWLLVAMLIVGVNLAGIRVALEPKWTWVPGAGGAIVYLRQLPDGSVVKYSIDPWVATGHSQVREDGILLSRGPVGGIR